MLAPDRAHLLIGRKFSARGGGFRAVNRGAFLVGQIHNRRIVSGELQDKAGNVILRGGGKTASSFKGAFKQFRHVKTIPFPGPEQKQKRRQFCRNLLTHSRRL